MSSLARLIMTVDARYDLLLTIPVCVEVYSSVKQGSLILTNTHKLVISDIWVKQYS